MYCTITLFHNLISSDTSYTIDLEVLIPSDIRAYLGMLNSSVYRAVWTGKLTFGAPRCVAFEIWLLIKPIMGMLFAVDGSVLIWIFFGSLMDL